MFLLGVQENIREVFHDRILPRIIQDPNMIRQVFARDSLPVKIFTGIFNPLPTNDADTCIRHGLSSAQAKRNLYGYFILGVTL